MKRIETFEEFWPFYVREHANPQTRKLHFAGTTVVLGLVGASVLLGKRWPLALAPLAGYGPAWVAHFFVEKNKPASFQYPVWSLLADFKMWGLIASGQMDEEIARIENARPATAREPAPRAPEAAASN